MRFPLTSCLRPADSRLVLRNAGLSCCLLLDKDATRVMMLCPFSSHIQKLPFPATQNTLLMGNTAGSATSSSGLGGGIFMGDMCSGGSCTTVGATLQSVNFTGNYAHLVS